MRFVPGGAKDNAQPEKRISTATDGGRTALPQPSHWPSAVQGARRAYRISPHRRADFSWGVSQRGMPPITAVVLFFGEVDKVGAPDPAGAGTMAPGDAESARARAPADARLRPRPRRGVFAGLRKRIQRCGAPARGAHAYESEYGVTSRSRLNES
jgi:hypothetical protein